MIEHMEPLQGITYGIIAMLLVLAPAIVARFKKHRSPNAIFLLSAAALPICAISVAVGLLVWIGALIWAITLPAKAKQ